MPILVQERGCRFESIDTYRVSTHSNDETGNYRFGARLLFLSVCHTKSLPLSCLLVMIEPVFK